MDNLSNGPKPFVVYHEHSRPDQTFTDDDPLYYSQVYSIVSDDMRTPETIPRYSSLCIRGEQQQITFTAANEEPFNPTKYRWTGVNLVSLRSSIMFFLRMTLVLPPRPRRILLGKFCSPSMVVLVQMVLNSMTLFQFDS